MFWHRFSAYHWWWCIDHVRTCESWWLLARHKFNWIDPLCSTFVCVCACSSVCNKINAPILLFSLPSSIFGAKIHTPKSMGIEKKCKLLKNSIWCDTIWISMSLKNAIVLFHWQCNEQRALCLMCICLQLSIQKVRCTSMILFQTLLHRYSTANKREWVVVRAIVQTYTRIQSFIHDSGIRKRKKMPRIGRKEAINARKKCILQFFSNAELWPGLGRMCVWR